jgi:hypothetical protein
MWLENIFGTQQLVAPISIMFSFHFYQVATVLMKKKKTQPSKAKQSQAEPSKAKQSHEIPSKAKKSQAEPSIAGRSCWELRVAPIGRPAGGRICFSQSAAIAEQPPAHYTRSRHNLLSQALLSVHCWDLLVPWYLPG